MKRLIILLTTLLTFALGAEGELKWRYRLGTGEGVCSVPAIGQDGTIYLGSTDNYLYAINPDSTLKWKYKTGEYAKCPPVIGADGTIYLACADCNIYALERDGNLKWTYEVCLWVRSPPALGPDGTLYCSSWNNDIYAINTDGTLKWTTEGGGNPEVAPAVDMDGTIYMGTGDILRAYNSDGSLKWEHPNYWMGYITSTPSIGADGTIYFATDEAMFCAVNPDGTDKWWFQTEGWTVMSSAALGEDGTVYWGSFDSYLYALSVTPEDFVEMKWRFETGGNVYCTPAIGSDGTIYFGSYDGNLYALNPDGSLRWSYDLGDITDCSPAIGSDGTIYTVGSVWMEDTGYINYLYAINSSSHSLANSAWPKFQHDNQNTGRVEGVGVEEKPEPDPEMEVNAATIDKVLHVTYVLPEGQDGVLRVYDALGRRLEQMKVRSSGEVELTAPLSSGVYWVRLESKAGQASSKVVLLP